MRFIIPVIVFGSSLGCVTPCHKANSLALAPECFDDTSTLIERNRVQIFIINGNDPFPIESLVAVRKKINASGFAKVSTGGLLYVPYFESVIRKLHREEPETKIILLGYGFGVSSADGLAKKLVSQSIPIDTVIAMAPRVLPGFETVPDPSVNRVKILEPASTAEDDPATSQIVGIVTAALQSMPSVEATPLSALVMIDDPAPLPTRQVEVVQIPLKKTVTGTLTVRPKP